jgi:invasion protein IalB
MAQQSSDANTTTEVSRQDPTVWTLDCDNTAGQTTGSCQISQTVTVRETGQRIIMVVIQKDLASEATHMLLALPHRIYLPSGVALTIDANGAHEVAVETCDERACYATIQADGVFVGELRAGAEMSVVFHNLAQRPVTVPVPLAGFGGAFDQLP